MVFGDSHSWGFRPVERVFPTDRFNFDERWPGVMAQDLGESYEVIEETLNGRTTIWDDRTIPLEGVGVNGLAYLPAALGTHFPLDLVVIMLGVNDVKSHLGRTALEIALGSMQLAATVLKDRGVLTTYSPAKALIVSPPPLGKPLAHDWMHEIYTDDSFAKSKALAGLLGALAGSVGIPFFDAGTVAEVDGIDGLHLSAQANRAIGQAVAKEVQRILQ